MRRLSHGDLDTFLEVLRTVYASADPDRFVPGVTPVLTRLVAADRPSYNECPWKGRIRAFVVPHGEMGGHLAEALSVYGHQSPSLAYYRRTGRKDVVAFADFLSRPQLKRLPLWAEYYRHVEVETQMLVPLRLNGAGETREIVFALSRSTRDFSERDRFVMELLRPHLVQAHALSRLLGEMRAREAVLHEALDTGDGVILLDDTGAIRFASRRSRRQLGQYFDAPERAGERLPDALDRWLRQQDALLAGADGVPPPLRPLVVTRGERRLTVRFVPGAVHRRLVLEERPVQIEPARLAPLGLTARQREVLSWLAMGKTNAEIGTILGLSPLTVRTHLDHIYRKLGVESRAAAIVQALTVAGA